MQAVAASDPLHGVLAHGSGRGRGQGSLGYGYNGGNWRHISLSPPSSYLDVLGLSVGICSHRRLCMDIVTRTTLASRQARSWSSRSLRCLSGGLGVRRSLPGSASIGQHIPRRRLGASAATAAVLRVPRTMQAVAASDPLHGVLAHCSGRGRGQGSPGYGYNVGNRRHISLPLPRPFLDAFMGYLWDLSHRCLLCGHPFRITLAPVRRGPAHGGTCVFSCGHR